MENLALWIYLAGTVANLRDFACGIAITSLIIAGIVSFGIVVHNDNLYTTTKHSYKTPIRLLATGIIMALVAVFVPTERTVWAMLAANGVEEVVNSERVRGIADNSLQLLEKEISKRLNEDD